MTVVNYTCSSCGCSVSLGNTHGFGGGWIIHLYCRHCGTGFGLRYELRQPNAQSGGRTSEYEIKGPSTTQRVSVTEGLQSPSLICDVCKVEGPFGSEGPITDKPPKGLPPPDPVSFNTANANATGICPKCKKRAMKVTGEWNA